MDAMETVWNYVKSNPVHVSVGAGAIIVSWTVMKKLTRRTRECGVDYPKDTVILHTCNRTKTIPNLGHLSLKLETYLRIARIPYQMNFEDPFNGGPKKKIPWIEYNGVTMGDSQLIIEFLNKEYSLNLNDHLTTVEKSQAWAIQKWIEEFTYWLNAYSRWIIFTHDMHSNMIGLSPVNMFLYKFTFTPWIRNMMYVVGIGRHSNNEVHEMIKKDIRHFATLLGEKKYLMGDTISDVDCAAFGILGQVRWGTPDKCPGRQLLLGQKNIMEYLDRIKHTYWPDWDELEYSNSLV